MKLLSPKDRNDGQQAEQVRQILRVKELKEVLKDLEMKTAKAEADFMQALAGQRARWAREEDEHTLHVKQLRDEIDMLEKRKRSLSS